MVKPRKTASQAGIEIDAYTHMDKKRKNNPHVGLVTPETDVDGKKKKYEHDPHLDPQLQWSGKTEHTSFEVDTVSLHVHERIAPYSIIEKMKSQKEEAHYMPNLFDAPFSKLSNKDVIEFYKHDENWSNRLIAGDSLLVMNSMLEKEGMAGKVQMVYFDPPYGIKYGSNFQPFTNKRDVKDGKDEDLNQEPEMLKAFRDTWELGVHSYLTYIRDRLLLTKELLTESGSVFVQISDENIHHVREIMDEVFGKENFIAQLIFTKTGSMSGNFVSGIFDTLLWYGKNKKNTKFNTLYIERSSDQIKSGFPFIEMPSGECRRLTQKELDGVTQVTQGRRFQSSPLLSSGESAKDTPLVWQGITYRPGNNKHWKVSVDDLAIVGKAGRLYPIGNTMTFKKYLDESPYTSLTNLWDDTMESTFAVERFYVVQTATKVIQRCVLMTTDPGDLVFDPTCGSGTTAYVAEQWGRRWITCDTSRVAVTLAKQRFLTATYPYYQLAHPHEGVSSGFIYEQFPHITLKSIAKNELPVKEPLYDKPLVDKNKIRVTGIFTVEAVPAPAVKSIDDVNIENQKDPDTSIIRSGETSRQSDWRAELLKSGIRGRNNQRIEFNRVDLLYGTKFLHAEAETKEDNSQKVVFSFGPDHAPLEQRQVARAIEESQLMIPRPKMIIFAAFHFDPEASKDIDEMQHASIQLLKVQMNTDLLTKDLKKKQSSSDSFFFIGSPDVSMDKHKGDKYIISVNGFDYYDVKNGAVESGGNDRIAMWMLDTDYDGRSILPTQIFFPMSGAKDGWNKLSKNLKAVLDEDKMEHFTGTTSLPFEKGSNARIALKIIDDRGIESLKVMDLE